MPRGGTQPITPRKDTRAMEILREVLVSVGRQPTDADAIAKELDYDDEKIGEFTADV